MREALALVAFLSLAACAGDEGPPPIDESRQATGVKVGEVSTDSAVVWARLTRSQQRRADGIVRRARADRDNPETLDPTDLEGSVPGAPGNIRLVYSTSRDLADAVETDWLPALAENDFAVHFRLSGLAPDTAYYFETRTADSESRHQPLAGSFKTAPVADRHGDVTFTVITGQAYKDADRPDGFQIYESMLALEPEFIIPTGDTVYYDSDDPLVTSIDLARYHWQRIYSYPTLIEFHRQVPGYWEKDDHDSYANDNWPGMVRDYMGTFSFEQGLKVFAEHTPQSDKPYRRFRWGKGIEVWLVEGRDFRSPNDAPDGPDKTIWGQEQKDWLKESLLASDADWKVLVSPTPIVGPDRGNKNDNHANVGFTHEGDEFRSWAQQNLPENFFVACGDRHWQYHSIHPATGVQEFSSGPASDQHAGGTPGLTDDYHQFHRVEGGFLSVNTKQEGDQSTIIFRLHAVDGAVVYEWSRSKTI